MLAVRAWVKTSSVVGVEHAGLQIAIENKDLDELHRVLAGSNTFRRGGVDIRLPRSGLILLAVS